MNNPAFDAKRLVASLPRRPGVYRMYDASGELIYVGTVSYTHLTLPTILRV